MVQLLSIAALTTGCVASQQGAASFDDVDPPAADASTIEALPRRICAATDAELVRRIVQGANQKRSGEIQLVPPESLQAGGLSHASPFDTTQQVPLLVTGDGIVRPGVYERRVTLADVAPTAAEILKFPGFRAPDGSPLSEALLPAAERDVPRLVVTVIWDSAGTDLLDRWDEGWPRLRELADRSAWFTDAALDASPSNTPPSHATIGTGAFPRTHGIPDEYVRFDGRIERPLHLGPRVLRVPTLGDRYDLAMGNESLVGTVGSLSAHLLMMSRGSFVPGADRDLAVTREPKDSATGGDDSAPRWQLSEEMAPYYAFPAYANDPSMDDRFLTEIEALDRADGADDGRWRDHEISSLLGGWDTPARSAWQTDMVEAVIEREGFGADDVPDLLYVNYKMLDSLGHSYSADGVELLDGLRAQDRELERLVRILDERVGTGRMGDDPHRRPRHGPRPGRHGRRSLRRHGADRLDRGGLRSGGGGTDAPHPDLARHGSPPGRRLDRRGGGCVPHGDAAGRGRAGRRRDRAPGRPRVPRSDPDDDARRAALRPRPSVLTAGPDRRYPSGS